VCDECPIQTQTIYLPCETDEPPYETTSSSSMDIGGGPEPTDIPGPNPVDPEFGAAGMLSARGGVVMALSGLAMFMAAIVL
jgi:hypothetical protein